MARFCLKFEGNTHVKLKGNIRPKMNEQQNKENKQSQTELSISNT